MSERPYLSIGEVLELLKGDFPDLSISRIRALESAGALELERTASGYRKFYDGDISYLRTLLNGSATGPQRRLSERQSDSSGTASSTGAGTSGARTSGAGSLGAGSLGAGSSRIDALHSDDHHDDSDDAPELGPNGELPGEPERRHPAAFQSLRRELASRPSAAGAAGSSSQSSASRSGDPGTAAPDAATRASATSEPANPEPSQSTAPPQLSVVPSGKPTQAADRAEPPPATPAQADPAVPLLGSQNPLAANASGLSLTLDELVTATGLTIEAIRELESLGLLRGQTVFSSVYYDEDSLLTCKLVAAFGTYGVEPRHLRMYKLAADREASFFEQVVTPQLRRKNPDARQGAIDTLGELVRLGEQLRVVALRQVLKASINK